MLACSFCLDVAAPSWWSPPAPLPVVLLALLGLVIGFVALDRAAGRRRTGGVLVAVGLAVLLPLAALSVRAGRMSVDVVTENPPADAPAWNVTCEAAFQGPGDPDLVAACGEATAAWRWTATALAATSVTLVVAGAALAASRGRRPDDDGPPNGTTPRAIATVR